MQSAFGGRHPQIAQYASANVGEPEQARPSRHG